MQALGKEVSRMPPHQGGIKNVSSASGKGKEVSRMFPHQGKGEGGTINVSSPSGTREGGTKNVSSPSGKMGKVKEV